MMARPGWHGARSASAAGATRTPNDRRAGEATYQWHERLVLVAGQRGGGGGISGGGGGPAVTCGGRLDNKGGSAWALKVQRDRWRNQRGWPVKQRFGGAVRGVVWGEHRSAEEGASEGGSDDEWIQQESTEGDPVSIGSSVQGHHLPPRTRPAVSSIEPRQDMGLESKPSIAIEEWRQGLAAAELNRRRQALQVLTKQVADVGGALGSDEDSDGDADAILLQYAPLYPFDSSDEGFFA